MTPVRGTARKACGALSLVIVETHCTPARRSDTVRPPAGEARGWRGNHGPHVRPEDHPQEHRRHRGGLGLRGLWRQQRAGETPGERRRLRAAFPVLGCLGRSAAEHGDALDPGHRASAPAATWRCVWRWRPIPRFNTLVVKKNGLTATAAHDGCIKIRLKGLAPATTYYYRFSFLHGTTRYRSRPGRTRTAPLADRRRRGQLRGGQLPGLRGPLLEHLPADAHQGADGADFLVSIGDYIYETTGPRLPDPGRPAIDDLQQSRRGHRPGRRKPRGEERGQLPRHLPYLPERPAAAASPRALAGDRHLGRPRVLRRLPGLDRDLLRRPDQRAGRRAATQRRAGVLRVPPGGRGSAGQRPAPPTW